MGSALEDVKVVDLTWALVGPAAVRHLADHGATVVRVESATHIDPIRAGPPFKDGVPGVDRSAEYANYNANKLSVTLDLTKQEARDVVIQLAGWADILVESFTPRVLRSWGITHERLAAVNPRLVMVSTCLYGQTGPWAQYAGYGVQGAAQAGFTNLIGWPDRDPALAGAYTDYVASRFVAVSIMAALDHARRSGAGQHVDVSQVEASLQFLAPALLQYQDSGHDPTRVGNRSPDAVPHAVLPCSGVDQWIAIEVHTDEQWRGLCAAAEPESWAADPRFATFLGRRRNESELETRLAGWTVRQDARVLEQLLQDHGVPARKVYDVMEAGSLPQLIARSHFVDVAYEPLGRVVVENTPYTLSRTPSHVRAVPALGEHNSVVLRDLLGMSEDQIMRLVEGGAVN